jgi:hypothetical protein
MAERVPIPVHWGQCRAAPHVICYVNFTSQRTSRTAIYFAKELGGNDERGRHKD